MARSRVLSDQSISALLFEPSSNSTVTSFASPSCTTWELVSIMPFASIITPVPIPVCCIGPVNKFPTSTTVVIPTTEGMAFFMTALYTFSVFSSGTFMVVWAPPFPPPIIGRPFMSGSTVIVSMLPAIAPMSAISSILFFFIFIPLFY